MTDPDTPSRADHLKPFRWAKGRSGNPGGRPRGGGVTGHLRTLLRQGHNGKVIAALVAERILKEALSGKPAALQMLLERTEGKPTERVQVRAESRAIVINVPPPRVLGEPARADPPTGCDSG